MLLLDGLDIFEPINPPSRLIIWIFMDKYMDTGAALDYKIFQKYL
jgi:hypothetical protein